MKSYIIGVFTILLMSSCLYASAQVKKKTDSHITGHILDAQTLEHIPYVTIGVNGTPHMAISDATGHFLLKNIPIGKQTLSISCVGYELLEKEVIVEKDKTIEVKFSLEKQVLEINTVVVTGSRNKQNRREASTIVNVMSSKQFETTASNNLGEALNYKPGLRVEQNCSNCGFPQLRINGLEGQYSQILLDSRPVFSSLASVYGLEQLPTAMIERVEVIRGGGSALFGSNAVGGVVNIITKEPTHNSLTLSNYSSFYKGGVDMNNTFNGSFVSDNLRAGVYLFGMVKNRDSYDRNGDGFSESPKVDSETIGFRGYYKLTQNSRLTAEYHHIREFRRGGNMLDKPAHEADIAEQLRHNINGGGVTYDLFSDGLNHRLSLYTSMQNIDRESYFGTNQNLDAYGTTKDFTFVGGGVYAYQCKKLLFMPSEMTVGAEYTNNNLNDKMLGYNRTIEQRSMLYGTYLQNEWKSKKLSILIGARLDKHNKVDNPIFSPRANMRYSPNKSIGFRLSYSGGYRAPQAYDEDLHVAAVGGEVAIISLDPNLRPEYSKSISGSVDLYRKFGSIETNLLIEGFYTNLKDVFTLVEKGHDNQGNLLLERGNASGSVIKGVNIEAKVGFTRKLILDAGFTIQNSRYKDPFEWSSENEKLEPQRKMFRSPDQYGYMTLNYLPFKNFTTSVNAKYTGSMLVQHFKGNIAEDREVNTPSFVDLGLRLAYDIHLSGIKLQINGGVKNVLDAFQKDIDKGVLRDSGYIYGPAMPRAYFVGLKFTI